MAEIRGELKHTLDNISSDDLSNSLKELTSDVDARITLLERRYYSASSPGSALELSVGKGGTWGVWTEAKYCPSKYYVCGLQQRAEPTQGKNDDTGVTGIRFYCCSL